MTIEKLTFLALKQIIKNENRRGDVLCLVVAEWTSQSRRA